MSATETITTWANIYSNGEVGVARAERQAKFSARGTVVALLRLEITNGCVSATVHQAESAAKGGK